MFQTSYYNKMWINAWTTKNHWTMWNQLLLNCTHGAETYAFPRGPTLFSYWKSKWTLYYRKQEEMWLSQFLFQYSVTRNKHTDASLLCAPRSPQLAKVLLQPHHVSMNIDVSRITYKMHATTSTFLLYSVGSPKKKLWKRRWDKATEKFWFMTDPRS